ncbi:alkaline-phosphatase-like protein [Echria macrotheca]|uniref:Alkaline-phosphatase-like protein n=1 Tax=Echria macrotheca TaxID=438768 RepID=A0AAJ0B214_9PEZI|nr:alkaline-phosphatase-like protein [Echria macrotheca]
MPLQQLDTSGQGARDASLLSPSDYDADAASIRSDQDTDSDDDERQLRARNSRELRAHDRLVLMEEDELDQLVTETRKRKERERRGSGLPLPLPLPNPLALFGRRGSDLSPTSPRLQAESSTEDLHAEKRNLRRARRKAKRERLLSEAQHGEDGELMYEMEEGGIKEGSSTGESSDRDDSDERDRKGLLQLGEARAGKSRSWRRWLLIHAIIIVGFVILGLLAWKLSLEGKRRAEQDTQAAKQMVSNGTAMFAPTTIIISLDGFRADFVNRGLTPRLNAFIKEGVSPLYMLPSFPSVTFPNHFTLATGLYPEAHGVVGNSFWDPELKEEFYYTDPSRSLDPKWWNGEPFWVTAQKQGLKTAVHMWPGSEAHVLHVEPTYMDKYNGKEKLSRKVDRVLEFLDLPDEERPQVIAAYVPNVDSDGHKYGPNSTEIRSTIQNVDTMLDDIFKGLEERHLTEIVNVIVVSDHGMATTDISRLVQIEDLLDVSKIEHTDGWPLIGLRPKDPKELQTIYDGLVEKTKDNPNLEVYLRDVNMPERYHFSHNDRIAPLWIVPKTGWALVRMEEMNLKEAQAKNMVYHPRGLHGYDHEHPLMRAIFIARGPAFPHQPNSRVDAFQNIEVYNILCDSVGITPAPNNGTLRLPLKPVGLHSNPVENPIDPPTHTPSPSASDAPTSTKYIQVDPVPASSTTSSTPSADPPKPTNTNGDDSGEKKGSAVSNFWNWFTGKVDEWWGKVTGSPKGKTDDKEEPSS